MPGDFDIAAPAGATSVEARVIGVIENQAPTKALVRRLPVVDGRVSGDRAQDVCQIAVVERHRGTGQVTNALVSGFGYGIDCAVASTVAHDSHHMIVVGTDDAHMALAANAVAQCGMAKPASRLSNTRLAKMAISALTMVFSGAVTRIESSVPALLGMSGATTHLMPKAV